MRISLDRDLLTELGLGDLSPEDARLVLETMYETLQLRVGLVLNQRMTSDQMARFNAAVAIGRDESLRVLAELAPDYQDVVAAEFEVLRLEVATDAPTILHTCVRPDADHDPWRHTRPDPGPTLVIPPGGWRLVVSPQAEVCVSLDPGGSELYARRSGWPPVVLRVPDGHVIDPTMLWCDDRGEVRARFAARSDLRWRLADAPTSALIQYDKVLFRQRAPLLLVDHRLRGPGLIESDRGRWHIEDAYEMEVTDRVARRSIRLEPLHEENHWNAVVPHFTPDGSQLVAAFYTDDPPEAGGLAACSVGYLDAMLDAEAGTGVDDAGPWEHVVHPTATDDRLAAAEPIPPIVAIGYDASSTRAVVADRSQVHLFHVREWEHLGTVDRPDQSARVTQLELPGGGVPLLAWSGRSLLVLGADDRCWRLDLQRGAGALEPLSWAAPAQPVAAVSWTDRAAAVCADRTVLGVDADGATAQERLPGQEPLRGATATADGRLLTFTDSGIELFAGTRLVDTAAVDVPIAGIAPCARNGGWAIAWHVDQSVSSVRLGARAITATRRALPHPPKGDAPLQAIGAEMSDVDRWHLLVPPGTTARSGKPHVRSPVGIVETAATVATSMPSSGLAVFGTTEGLEFLPALRPDIAAPRPVALTAPVETIATGRCARSVAAAGDGVLWLVRLLR